MKNRKLTGIVIFILLPLFVVAQMNERHGMMFSDTSRIGRPYAKDPYVIKFRGRYLMYYSVPGKKSTDSWVGWGIGIAESKNLFDWKKIAEILPSADAFEKKGICAPCALVMKGKVHLFYQTYGNGANDAICHAWSTDGISFKRNTTNPVFKATGDWNCGRAIDAEVIRFKGRYFLYFATRDPHYKEQIMGVATAPANTDFSRQSWTQISKERLLKLEYPWEGNCTEAASVIHRNGKLYMFYAGNYNNSPQQIGVAESDDGIRWKKCSDKPFLTNGKKNDWNSSESGHPHIFDNGKTTYLFFQGNNDGGKTWLISNEEVVWSKTGPKLKPQLR